MAKPIKIFLFADRKLGII